MSDDFQYKPEGNNKMKIDQFYLKYIKEKNLSLQINLCPAIQ